MSTEQSKDRVVGFLFEGVGTDSSKSKGTVWGYGDGDLLESGYNFEEVLTRPPRSVSVSVDPFEARPKLSSFSPEFALTDTVAETFLYKDVGREATLNEELDDAETSIDIDDGGALANTVVYVDEEAIKLGSFSSGTYSSCTRGYYNSTAKRHDDGQHVYTGVNFWERRIVWLVAQREDESSLQKKWKGVVTNRKGSSDGTTVTISCNDVLSELFGAKIARGVPPLSTGQLQVIDTSRQGVGEPRISGPFHGTGRDNGDAFVRKDGSVSTTHPQVIQVGGACVFATESDVGVERPRFGSSIDAEVGSSLSDGQGWPLLAFGEHLEEVADGDYPNQDFSSTQSMSNPHHPLTILSAMLNSTADSTNDTAIYDVLDSEYGLSLVDYFDLSADQIIAETPSEKVRLLILGWDGKPIDVFEVGTEVLLKPFGFFWSVDEDGTLGFSRLRQMDVEDLSNADSIDVRDTKREWRAGPGAGKSDIKAKFGGRPWSDPRLLRTESSGNARRPGKLSVDEKTEIDFRAFLKESAESESLRLLRRVTLAHYPMPRLTVEVDDTAESGHTYNLGDFVTINSLPGDDPWLVDNTGSRVQLTADDVQFAGMIIGRDQDVATGVYTLTLLLTNFRTGHAIKWRAPAMEITGVANFATRIYTKSSTQFGYLDSSGTPQPDNNSFAVGDDIQIYNPDGSVVATSVYQISDIGNDGTPYIDLTRVLGFIPSSGDFVRLASYDSYANDGGVLSGVNRAWAYFADSSENLGSNNDAGDVYG